MRFLTWLVGVFVLLLALELSAAGPRGWLWVWITAMVVWFFAGAGLGVAVLAKLVTRKMGAGALPGFGGRRPVSPATHESAPPGPSR
jgi:hypothetical protein